MRFIRLFGRKYGSNTDFNPEARQENRLFRAFAESHERESIGVARTIDGKRFVYRIMSVKQHFTGFLGILVYPLHSGGSTAKEIAGKV